MRSQCIYVSSILLCTFQMSSAWADCEAAPGYEHHENKVDKCVTIDGSPGCPGGTMLRENAETGEIVALSGLCDGYMYLDECVPKGTYRYGSVIPFYCQWFCAGTPPFYIEITVTWDVTGCTLSEGNPGNTPYDKDPPWKGKPNDVCYGQERPPHEDDGGADGGGADGGGADESGGDGGCAVVSPGAGMVFSINALALLAGLLLLARRRGR